MNNLARSPQQIGTLVRRARKAKGWSQGELGLQSGLRQGTVSQIESGHAGVRLETLLSVLAALGLEFRIGPRGEISGEFSGQDADQSADQPLPDGLEDLIG